MKKLFIANETEEMEVNLIPNDEVPKEQLEKDADSMVNKLNLLGVKDIKTIYQNPSDNFEHGAMNIKGIMDSSKEDSIRDDAIAFLESDLPDYFGSFEYSEDSEAVVSTLAKLSIAGKATPDEKREYKGLLGQFEDDYIDSINQSEDRFKGENKSSLKPLLKRLTKGGPDNLDAIQSLSDVIDALDIMIDENKIQKGNLTSAKKEFRDVKKKMINVHKRVTQRKD